MQVMRINLNMSLSLVAILRICHRPVPFRRAAIPITDNQIKNLFLAIAHQIGAFVKFEQSDLSWLFDAPIADPRSCLIKGIIC